tara:strand:+ start:318 stop:479 length:162 start_codon:yes stop_codon:yes gene_type:complete
MHRGAILITPQNAILHGVKCMDFVAPQVCVRFECNVVTALDYPARVPKVTKAL